MNLSKSMDQINMNNQMMNQMNNQMMNQMNNQMMNQMNNQMMMNQMNNQMMMNQMNNQMMMNQMNNQMMMNQMNNQMVMNQMNNPMMMNRINNPMMFRQNNSSKMVIPMMMNPAINGFGVNKMTKEQIELHKQQMRYQGYLAGKKMAEEKKRREQGNNPQIASTGMEQANNGGEITIRFNKGGSIKNIKMNSESMVAELIDVYCQQTNNRGTFQYKGTTLNPEDCSSLSAIGMRNGDEIIVT